MKEAMFWLFKDLINSNNGLAQFDHGQSNST